jgi:hypothetical protein
LIPDLVFSVFRVSDFRAMTQFTKRLAALLLVASAALLAGCTTKTEKDTSIPWSRPADWEGQIPGMGGR